MDNMQNLFQAIGLSQEVTDICTHAISETELRGSQYTHAERYEFCYDDGKISLPKKLIHTCYRLQNLLNRAVEARYALTELLHLPETLDEDHAEELDRFMKRNHIPYTTAELLILADAAAQRFVDQADRTVSDVSHMERILKNLLSGN